MPGVHYESAALRTFVGGRTETIRSCSSESVAFAQAMLDTRCSKDAKLEALKAAVESHKNYSNDAAAGLGADRHLLGLKLAAKEMGYPMPQIFSDVGFTRSTHYIIATSQVPTLCDAIMSYGPLVEDGYGCCYNPRKHDINMSVSAFINCPSTSPEYFKAALEQSLIDVQELFGGGKKK